MGMKRCVIFGAAPNEAVAGVDRIQPDDFILCADGGLEVALRYGLRPDFVIGDCDSMQNPELVKSYAHRLLPVEKDDTDMIAALRYAKEQGFSACLLLNATGGRPDHTFANYSALFFAEQSGIQALLLEGRTEVRALTGGKLSLCERKGERFSAFAFGCSLAVVQGEGFHYPLHQLTLRADFPLGVSNEIETDDAWIEVVAGKILLMTEKI